MDLPTDSPRNDDKMQAFEPTLGERISGGLQSLFESMGADRYQARRRAQSIIGGPSSNLPLNLGVADIAAGVSAPAALAMAPVYASQGIKDIGEAAASAERGDYLGAGVEGAFGALNMLPMVSGLTGLARKALPSIKPEIPRIVESPYEPPRTDVLRAAEPTPQAAPNVQPVQTVQLPDGRFATTTQLSEVKQLRTGSDAADSPAAVAHLTAGLRKSPQEQLVAVVVDENNKPLQVIRHTIGLSGQTSAEPFSLVGAIANVPGAKSYWLSHNHPSGNTILSDADINLGKSIKELTRDTGIEMRGILAIGKDRFGFSDLQNPASQNLPIPPRARDKTVTMTERTFRRSGVLDQGTILGPASAARVADQIAGDQTGVILFNTQSQPVGFMPLRDSELMNLRKSGESNRLLAAMEKANSPRAMLVSNKNLNDDAIKNISALFLKAGVNLLDVLNGPQRESVMMNVGRIPNAATFQTIAPIGAGLTAASVMSPEEGYAKGGAVNFPKIEPIKPLDVSVPEIDLPVSQKRHPEGLSEPEAAAKKTSSLDRLKRLLEPQGYADGGEVDDPFRSGKPLRTRTRRPATQEQNEAMSRAVMQGLANMPYNILGAPGDIANILAAPTGRQPFYGSEAIKDLATRAGIRPAPPTDPTQAALYGAADIGSALVNPAAVTRGAARGAQAVAGGLERAARDFQAYNRALDVPGASYAVAYHGSPHRFEKFDSSKIGTGEGNQTYGHGMYFAEAPETGRTYAIPRAIPDVEGMALKHGLELSRDARIELMRQAKADRPAINAAKMLQNASRETRSMPANKLAETINEYREANRGHLYTVDIPDEMIARMINRDMPLGQQRKVIEGIKKGLLHPESPLDRPEKFQLNDWLNDYVRMQNLQPQSVMDLNNPRIVKSLQQAGLPGIQYFDAGSRGAGQGTRNFVVFPGEEDAVKILKVE
jgi:hypothetical protein